MGVEQEIIVRDEYFCGILEELAQESRLLLSKEFIQHGCTSVYAHSVQVAYESYLYAKRKNLNVDYRQLIRGALLHDYFLYDWHNQLTPHHLHGFFHPGIALRNASEDLVLTAIERDIIRKHMFPLTMIPPRYTESWIVCWIDKCCSMRETIFRRRAGRMSVS